MARSDLLVSLVKASVAGDKQRVHTTVEKIAAEEKAKQHTILANRLIEVLSQPNGGHHPAATPGADFHRLTKDLLIERTPRKRLADLILPEVCRSTCRQILAEQHRASLLRSHGLEPRHRILLTGPPGNGKTSLAEALAQDLCVPFFVVRYEAVIGSFLGETATRLRRIFDYAQTTPCVLFFDEFDTIGKERGDTHETGEIKRVVSSLLLQVDALPSYAVLICATNHEELLDRAAWRRFQIRLSLPAPSPREISAFLAIFAKQQKWHKGWDAKAIAKRLGRISFAEVEEFCLDVLRCQVLGLGDISLDDVLKEQLRSWETRAAPTTRTSKPTHARAPSPPSA